MEVCQGDDFDATREETRDKLNNISMKLFAEWQSETAEEVAQLRATHVEHKAAAEALKVEEAAKAERQRVADRKAFGLPPRPKAA